VPFDPSLYLSQNLDPGDDGDGDAFINLSLADLMLEIQDSDEQYIHLDVDGMLIEIQDSDGNLIDLDLSGDPIIKVENSDNGSHGYLDENSLNLSDGDTGNAADLEANSLSLYDAGTGATVSIDASATGGHDVSFQEVQICVSGTTKTIRVLASAPY
jgi:hypothetical protein